MHKVIKEYIKKEVAKIVEAIDPDYLVLKSASIAGGVTLRKKKDKTHLFIVLEFIPQRERFKINFAWSKLGRVPKFADVETICEENSREKKLAPFELFEICDEGSINATAFGNQIDVIDIDPAWVPWATILDAMREPSVRARLALFLGADLLISLEAEPMQFLAQKEEGPLGRLPLTFSWEQWFSDILCRDPSENELRELLMPSLLESKAQISEKLLPFADNVAGK